MSAQVHTLHTLMKVTHKIYMRPEVGWLRLEGQLAAKILLQFIRIHLLAYSSLLTRQLGEHSSYYTVGKLTLLHISLATPHGATQTKHHIHTHVFHTLSAANPW